MRTYLIAVVTVLVLGAVLLFVPLKRTVASNPVCPERCNVILIVVDTLSAQHLASYGYERDTMPKIEKFFEEGVRFEHAYAVAPWTEPTFVSLFFSDLPSRISHQDLEEVDRTSFVSELREGGYRAYGVLLPVTVFIYDAIAKVFDADDRHFVNRAFSTSDPKSPFAEMQSAAVALRGRSSEWRETGTPFLLFIHNYGPHAPFNPTPAHSRDFGDNGGFAVITAADMNARNANLDATEDTTHLYRLKYDQKIRDVDDTIGQFLNSIPEDVLNSSVVILTADHGEAFNQHGRFGHHQSLFNEETRVPLFIRAPGLKPQVVREPVSILDIGPTILSIAGIAVPRDFIGRDLFGRSSVFSSHPVYLEDGTPFFAQGLTRIEANRLRTLADVGAEGTEHPIVEKEEEGVIIWPWKFMTQKDKTHVFNLEKDPGEMRDLLQDASSLTTWERMGLELFKIKVRLKGYSLEPEALGEGEKHFNLQG